MRDRLRQLAEDREATMADTLDDALEALRRDQFYKSMADAERVLRAEPDQWRKYTAERDAWLNPDLSAR